MMYSLLQYTTYYSTSTQNSFLSCAYREVYVILFNPSLIWKLGLILNALLFSIYFVKSFQYDSSSSSVTFSSLS